MTKILVIRLSSIGDIVLTSPIIRCIKQQLKGVELHCLTKKQYASLYTSNPYIDYTHEWQEGSAFIKELKAQKFDYIVDLHKNLRTYKVKGLLRCKSASFPKLNYEKWLLVRFKKNILPDIHIVDRYFEAVKKLGVKNDQQGLDFFITSTNEQLKQRVVLERKYIALAIGGQHATKRMPVEKLAQVLRDVKYPIVIIGGAEDRDEAEKLKTLLPAQEVDNTCGELSIQESAKVIKEAAVLITHDTGMMHIGAAFTVPIVSIWGNTVPEFGMYPYRPNNPDSYTIHEVKNLDCRPCSKLGFDTCPKGHFKCMMDQDTKAIQKQVLSFIESN